MTGLWPGRGRTESRVRYRLLTGLYNSGVVPAKDLKIVFVHGYTSSSRDNWYPNMANELSALGVDFEVPDLPGGEFPHADAWLSALHKVISKETKPLVLVGHSLGTRAILLYLEKYSPKVEAVFLIAAFANRLENARKYDGDGYPDFFEHLVDIEKVKALAGKFVVMHSRDDGLHYEQGAEIAKELGARLITYEDRGHFSDTENAKYVLDVLRKELDF